jgi:MFS family permease
LTGSPSIETQHGHPGIVLATLSLANVMALLDLFVVNVALHDIGVGLHYQSSLSDVAWVLNAYALFFGALLIPAGRFADKYGRKATLILGLAVFTVASLVCAVSPDLWVLVGFRCVQAAGAAMIIPASLGLVLTTLPPDRVKRGVRVWAVSGAAAGSIGPVVGGLLTALSWRWIFVINLPIGIAAVLVTWKMIPNVRHDRTTRMPDLLGSLMIVVTIGAISLGLLNGANWGWGSAKIIGSWAAAVAAAVAFVVSTRRAAVLGASLIVARLHQRFPIGAVVASGFVLTAAGQALMILTLRHGVHNYAAAVLPGWVVIGFGLGFTVPTIIGSATADLPPEQSATGSAVVNSGRQFGGVFGASILVVVLGKAEVTGDPGRFYELWWVAVALCAAAVVVSLGLTPKRQPAKADVTVPVVAAATDSTDSSVA